MEKINFINCKIFESEIIKRLYYTTKVVLFLIAQLLKFLSISGNGVDFFSQMLTLTHTSTCKLNINNMPL